MDEMPGMIRPDLQALPQVKDRMTFCMENVQPLTFPRIRGGDPPRSQACPMVWHFSPLPRLFQQYFALFPAHAGVILFARRCIVAFAPFPRTCGGDPIW